MASMARQISSPPENGEDEEFRYPEEEVFTDSLESITRDLPTGEPSEAEENPGETPEEARKRFFEEKGIEEPGEAPAAPPRQKKGKGRKKEARESMTDANLQSQPEMSREHPVLRRVFLLAVTFMLVLIMVAIALYRIAPISNEAFQNALETMDESIAESVSPVQNFFSTIVNSARTLIFRANYLARLEDAYNELREENEQLVYKAMLVDELQHQVSQFEIMQSEADANKSLEPVVCSVIGKSDGNYFSTFTINRGRNDGIEEYMAVIVSGALVGYTEQVTDTQSTVRAIIDSEASIAALIQSSRDQGTVRGTLGIDGTAMCRMYYLPDDHLPRPGDIVVTSGVSMPFPKGIPIGTVRESTRGMDANKQYIVVEPTADFQHIEYVMVLTHKSTASQIQSRSEATLAPKVLETERPVPPLRVQSKSFDSSTSTATPEASAPAETPSPTPEPSLAPVETQATETLPPQSEDPTFEYHMVSTTDPNVTASPTPSPTPTPYVTLGPEDMTLEEDE